MTDLTPDKIPGALEVSTERTLPDGSVIEFEFAPMGWLTKKGEPRLQDWRAYFHTPQPVACVTCQSTGRVEGKTAKGKACSDCRGTGTRVNRTKLVSVTTMLEPITSKGGLPRWAEARGIEGAVRAIREGLLDPDGHDDDAIATVRRLKLGADRARDDAADRGVNVHALGEEFMKTGRAPRPNEHPEAHRGYIRAYVRWLLYADPHPSDIELLVASPNDGYAGRLDLVATRDGQLVLHDFKTQAAAGIFSSAHVQAALYRRGYVHCGGTAPDRTVIVAFAENGEFREMDCLADDRTVEAAIAWYRALKPIESACESGNRVEREARRAA